MIADLLEDKEAFFAYQANIAMAFMDEYSRYKKQNKKKYLKVNDIHKISNRAAKYFLDQLQK